MEFKLVRQLDDANSDAILVTLYRCEQGQIRGWYVGPLRFEDGGVVPYAPPSKKLLGMVAVLRGHDLANQLGLDCYVIDPDDLWSGLSQD